MKQIGLVLCVLTIVGLAVPASALPILEEVPSGAMASCSSRWVEADAWVTGGDTLNWKVKGCEPDPFQSKVKGKETNTGVVQTCYTSGGVPCETTTQSFKQPGGGCADVQAYLYPWDDSTVLTDFASACTSGGDDDGDGDSSGGDDGTCDTCRTGTGGVR